ncbi:MAG: L-aspartate oxidase [Phycisphaerae bacterium]
MTSPYESRRYLTNFDARLVPHIFTDVLVIGSGVAGLRAAIEASQYGQVLVVTKAGLEDSNTSHAQGGIAVAMNADDRAESHIADTLRVGCGLCDQAVVELVVREGPKRIEELLQWGAAFDRQAGRLVFGREGGHSTNRVIHARGDATGRELATTLIRKLGQQPTIRVFENCFAIDLVTIDGRCAGAITYHHKYGHQLFWARQTILACGGIGRLYRETTNPRVATADGHAMGYRAGAVLKDMEMVQFHPTTLYVAGASRALISEAVRGEGAYLVDRDGQRFMDQYHPDGELAPRDVVSRAIVQQMARTGATHVYLDVRHLGRERFARRFPQICQLCSEFDIDVGKDLIPVRPSAHYMIGGLATDERACTSVPDLLACGEVACTGLHGANRLASNSLLEGLVFGRIAGQTAGEALSRARGRLQHADVRSSIEPSARTALDLNDVCNSLRSVIWRNVGIERIGQRLAETNDIVQFWGRYVMDKVFDDRFGWEVQNMLTVGRLIAAAAQTRAESRGVHYRSDYPQPNDRQWRCHVALQRQDAALSQVLVPCED